MSAKIVLNITDFSLFNADPKRHNYPSASCASAANAISRDSGIFNGGFFLNNQPDALITQIYSDIKLYMLRASSLPIIRSSLLYIRHWYVSCRFLMTVSILTLLGNGHQKPA
jgi:hypothetical protein